jgi:hypothetical protein
MSIWKLSYEALAGSRSVAQDTHGLRENPRFDVNGLARFQVRFGGYDAQVCDVSAGGMAIYSDRLMPGGGEIALTVNHALSIHTEVVYCAPKGEWGPGNPPQHKMGLKFLSENDGYLVAMLALEAEAESDGSNGPAPEGKLNYTLRP